MRRKEKHRRFVLLEVQTLDRAEWRLLPLTQMITYIYLKRNYNGRNNGSIPLKYKELADLMSSSTLSTALKGLIGKGWIEKTQHGGLYRYYCLYKLTGKYDTIK